jgi:hypothetical protein
MFNPPVLQIFINPNIRIVSLGTLNLEYVIRCSEKNNATRHVPIVLKNAYSVLAYPTDRQNHRPKQFDVGKS